MSHSPPSSNKYPSEESKPPSPQDRDEKAIPLKPIEQPKPPAETPIPIPRLKRMIASKSGKVDYQFRAEKTAPVPPAFDAPHPRSLRKTYLHDQGNSTAYGQVRDYLKKKLSERVLIRISHEIQVASRINSLRILLVFAILLSAYIGYKIGFHRARLQAVRPTVSALQK